MTQLTREQFQARLAKVQAGEPATPPAAAPAAAPPPPRRLGPKKDYACPSVAEYRGTTALANKPTKGRNVTDDPSATSLPYKTWSEAEFERSREVHRKPNDITAHQVNAIITGFGDLFTKDNCKTQRGWKAGTFAQAGV